MGNSASVCSIYPLKNSLYCSKTLSCSRSITIICLSVCLTRWCVDAGTQVLYRSIIISLYPNPNPWSTHRVCYNRHCVCVYGGEPPTEHAQWVSRSADRWRLQRPVTLPVWASENKNSCWSPWKQLVKHHPEQPFPLFSPGVDNNRNTYFIKQESITIISQLLINNQSLCRLNYNWNVTTENLSAAIVIITHLH